MPTTRRSVLSRSSVAFAGLLLSGYASAQQNVQEPADDIDDEMVRELGERVTAFGLDLHDQLVEERDEEELENLLVSPYSASIALAMTWAGARGETADEMADTLRFPFDQDQLHPTYSELDARVDPPESDEGETTDEQDEEQEFELETANALWGQEGFPFSEPFLDLLATHYGAGMNEVDYASDPEAARDEINEWVEDQTEERIEDLLPEGSITVLTRLVLTNAVYFAASWEMPFEEDATEDATFTALDGSTATVPMMHQPETERFLYADVDGTQVVSLPYVGEEVDMVVVLPPEGEFEAVEGSLDLETMRTYFDALEPAYGDVAVPRFSYESDFSLSDTLQALGMEAAFSAANFDGMIAADAEDERQLSIDDVLQKTFIDVDEEGTEAAAATAVIVDEAAAPMPEFEVMVDRPFLYAIRHRETNTALFLGRVVRLEGEEESDSSEGPDPIADDPPTDPDGDGLYQDITGDGEVGTDDVVTLFENLEEPAVTENVEYYDFDGSGGVGPSDVVALFEGL